MLTYVLQAQGGAVDLGNLPADPTLAWGVIAASVVIPLLPLLLNRMKRPAETDPKTPPPPASSAPVAPQFNEQSQLLSKMIESLEARVRAADEREDRHNDQVTELQRRIAFLEAEMRSLRRENDQLRGQLMRGSGL